MWVPLLTPTDCQMSHCHQPASLRPACVINNNHILIKTILSFPVSHTTATKKSCHYYFCFRNIVQAQHSCHYFAHIIYCDSHSGYLQSHFIDEKFGLQINLVFSGSPIFLPPNNDNKEDLVEQLLKRLRTIQLYTDEEQCSEKYREKHILPGACVWWRCRCLHQ